MGFAFPKLSYRASQRANMMRRTGHKQQTFRALGLLSFSLSALIASPSLAQTNSHGKLSAQLSALRAEVETLSNKVRQAQEVRNDRLRALEHSHTELQIALTKARSQHKLLTANKKTLLEMQATTSTPSPELITATENLLKLLGEHIDTSLPFKTSERSDALKKIKELFSETPENHLLVLERLWQFIADEDSLNRSFELNTDMITLAGQKYLVEVARIGMALLYFKTQDGRIGWLRPTGATYVAEVFEKQEMGEQVKALFANIRAQKGHFPQSLPFALPNGDNR